MSKPKKGPPAKKFVDSVMSELQDSDKGKAAPGEDTTSQQVHNVFLDGFGSDKKDDESSEAIIHVESVDDPDPPDGLVPTGKMVLNVKPTTPPAPPPHEESVTVPLTREQKAEMGTQEKSMLTDSTQPLIRAGGRGGHGNDPSVKVSYGAPRGGRAVHASAAGQASDAQLAQAENLKLAQSRINELEHEIERLRNENDLLSSAGSIANQKVEELTDKLHQLERARVDAIERGEMELKVAQDGLADRTRELNKAKKRIEELESKVTADVRKIRVRERELENRLELARLEKTALVRAKDETLLDLKRNLDQVTAELEGYKQKAADLQSKIDEQQEQLGRTVRALRLALTNLESSDSTSGQIVPMKKAE